MPTPPSESEILGMFDSCSNWGRWGPDDTLGTVNYITPEKRRQAGALIQVGESVTCSRPMQPEIAPDVGAPMIHYMTSTGERWEGKKSEPGTMQSSGDFFGLAYHGYWVTHVDSLCHVFWDGKMYNGVPAEVVTSRGRAGSHAIDVLASGAVTRGVLLDIPRLRNVKWLDNEAAIYPEELEEAEKAQGVRVESGDVLLVRTGWYRKRLEEGPSAPEPRPGLQGATVPWLHERQVAMLGGDGTNDHSPTGYPLVGMPIHQVGIVGMGLWLIDNANLEELAQACERHNRWEFMLTVAPLRIVNGTGSPANPIAVF